MARFRKRAPAIKPWYQGSITTAAAAATATVSASTTAAAAAAVSTAAATATLFARLGFVHGKTTTFVLVVVKAVDGRFRFAVAAHLDKTKALASIRLAIHDHLAALNGTVGSKQRFQVGVIHVVREIPDIKLPTHFWNSLRTRQYDPLVTFRVEEERDRHDDPPSGLAKKSECNSRELTSRS